MTNLLKQNKLLGSLCAGALTLGVFSTLPVFAADAPPAASPAASAVPPLATPPTVQKYADPTALPTPVESSPKGSPAPTKGDALDKLGKVTQKNNQWSVTLGTAAALPLQGNPKGPPPKLIALYSPATGALATQPSVLVYNAGTLTLGGANGKPVEVERALIFQAATNRPLMDALWAVRVPETNALIPNAQPIWHWSADKLVVDNPIEKTSQEKSFAPKAAAAPAATTAK